MIDEADIGALARAFDELAAAMRRSRARAAADSGAQLTPAQFELLRLIDAGDSRDGVRISALAAAAGVAKPTTTRMLNGLERAGLCQRAPTPVDGRGVSVVLTDAGREAVAAFMAFRHVKLRRFLARFDPAQRAAILEATSDLTRLADDFTEAGRTA